MYYVLHTVPSTDIVFLVLNYKNSISVNKL